MTRPRPPSGPQQPDEAGRLRPASLTSGARPSEIPYESGDLALPTPKRWFPGLTESLPLLLFGSACLALAVYSYSVHLGAFGTKTPLWLYLTGLGSIAVAGGLAASAAGESLEGLPEAGQELSGDLIVVPLAEWRALQSGAVARGRSGPGGRSRPREARPARAEHAPVAAARPALEGDRATWIEGPEDQETPPPVPAPKGPVTEADFREVMETLDSIVQATATSDTASTRRSPRPGTPSLPDLLSPAPPSSVPPSSPRGSGLSAEQALADLSRELSILSDAGAAAPAAPPTTCSGCGTSIAPGTTGPRCDSCGRPMCRSCTDRSTTEHHARLCPMCATLLSDSGG